MADQLTISIGQYSDKGRQETNQDFHGVLIPQEPLLSLKGVAIVLADGISTSDVSAIASETAVKSFLTDYYCTPESWSVKTSAQRVIVATNSWLHAQTRQSQHRYDQDRGYVCTLSALVIKGATAHIFHIGDARVYRVVGNSLEQLTEDHRVVVSSAQSYLGRALGVRPQVEIDYRAIAIQQGDLFVLATDGVYEHATAQFIAGAVNTAGDNLDAAARKIAEEAGRRSPDNLTVQIVRIDELSQSEAADVLGQAIDLPCPPLLEARSQIDGYEIVRELHASSRSHIYLAIDKATGATVAIKTPSIDLSSDAEHLRRFRIEEWIARRISNDHVLKAVALSRRRSYLYVVTELVEGQTLTQWMTDHPAPPLETVRDIVEQIAKGLQAFHRMEMIHQDLRPENVMIDRTGTAKIIDFGSTKILGVTEERNEILGTVQYTAPEYFLDDGGTPQSDIFSLGVIAYQMLTGRLPYGASAARAQTLAQQRKLRYRSVLEENKGIPDWVDGALRRAVHPDPKQRYGELSEFVFDLRHPNRKNITGSSRPLIERNPLRFWQAVAAILALTVVILLFHQFGAH